MRVLCLKSVGVKFKVHVKDRDVGLEGGNDDVDKLVQLLQLTPAFNVFEANWTSITINGTRSRYNTK